MVAKLSLKRLLYAFFLFCILVSVHFYVVNVKRLANDVEKSTRSMPVAVKKEQNTDELRDDDEVPAIVERTSSISYYDTLPWFFQKGRKMPTSSDDVGDDDNESKTSNIWPEKASGDDRITKQLMHVPRNYDERLSPSKTILLWHGLDRWVTGGRQSFLDAKCPVNKCTITDDRLQADTADLILFKDHFVLPSHRRPPNQVWMIYLLECPHHTERLQHNDLINWTATYRRDSDIVTPYERWVYYDDNVKENNAMKRNYAANKTHQVAWFVSNCNARNGRLAYAHELQKYLSVDIYGFCGPLRCPRTAECFEMLNAKYKFYLAFENSNCVDYITEKFFVNGLQHDILPIVMGARPQDYAAVAPYRSYIHVDDFASPKQLADYLLKLDRDDRLYNLYFRWKNTGEFINTYFFCRLCAMLHEPIRRKSYRNLNKWWRGVNTCIVSGSWKRN